MTGADLAALIGRQGFLRVTDRGATLSFPVQVLDAKRAWGNLRYQVTPLHNGQASPEQLGKDWVDSGRVTLA